MTEVRDLLFDYVLGGLPTDELQRVEEALNSDPQLRKECDELQETVSSLAYAAPSAGTPSPALRDRLIADATGSQRFAPFVDKLAQLFDVAADKAREYLKTIDEAAEWVDFTPQIRFHDFDGGPAVANARVGIVRVQAGHEFPMHQHKGREVVLVLQGATQDGEDIYRAGQFCEKADGTRHTTPAIGDQELIYAVVVPDVEVDDIPLPPKE